MQLREIEHALRAMLDESRAREEQTGWRAFRRRLRQLGQTTSAIFSRSKGWDEDTARWSWRRRLRPAMTEQPAEEIPEENDAGDKRSVWRLFQRRGNPEYFEQRQQELSKTRQSIRPEPQAKSIPEALQDLIEESRPAEGRMFRPLPESGSLTTKAQPVRADTRDNHAAGKENPAWRPFLRAKSPGAASRPKAVPLQVPVRPGIPAKTIRMADRRSDLIIAASGVALGLFCALFPWYVFLNQEKFGVQAMQFSGNGQGTRPARIAFSSRYETIEAPFAEEDLPFAKLDPFVTASLPGDNIPRASAALADQPFPGDEATFSLVHVVNGRAMIEDETGLWVVQRGSLLPDNSRVASIELRGKKWVLITSTDKIVELSQ
jgi:hypothetical protein